MESSFESKVNIILDSLAIFLGIPDLQFEEEDNTCTLEFNENLLINLTFDEERQELIIHSLIGQLPENCGRKMLAQLLEANLFWSGTRGATISLATESRQVILAKALSLCNAEGTLLSGEALGKALADLAEVNLYWKSFLENGPAAAETKNSFLKANTSSIGMA